MNRPSSRSSEYCPLSFLLGGLANIHAALLNRSMIFKKISLIDISSSVVGLVVVVTLACLHAGVWSLVAGTLTSSVISSILFWATSEWQPSFLFSWMEVRSVMNFGLNLSAFNLFNYFARNSDNAIVGRYLGSASLGFYQLAYNIMLFPVQGIAQVLISGDVSGVFRDPARQRKVSPDLPANCALRSR